ncbi:MAG TPA: MCP four helix bundle domain-containing protein, partial [Smithella sp.]|nr:MCP four helix bundle domain-containing protein [Smithella sp.]
MEKIIKSNFFDNLKLSIKLTGTFAFIFVFVTALMLSGAKVRMGALRGLDAQYSQYLTDIKNIGAFKESLTALQENIYRYVAVPSSRGGAQENIKKEMDAIEQFIQQYKNKQTSSDEGQIVAAMDSAWPEMQRGCKDLMRLATEGKHDEISRLLAEGSYFATARTQMTEAVNHLTKQIVARHEARVKETVKGKGGWSGILWIFSGIGALLLTLFGIMMNVSLTRPLKRALVMMQELEKGHLSKRLHLKRKDEIGDLTHAMDQFADRLQNSIVFGIKQLSEGNIHIAPAIKDDADEIGPALSRMTETLK